MLFFLFKSYLHPILIRPYYSYYNFKKYFVLDLVNALHNFVFQKTEEFNRKIYGTLLQSLRQPDTISKVKNDWLAALSNQNGGHEQNSSINAETAWSGIYHALIHSPALEALLRLEHSYSVAMKDLVKEKTDAMEAIRNR